MIEINELINLLVDLFCIPLLLLAFNKTFFSHRCLLFVPVILIVTSHIMTIVESFFFPEFFNLLEHLTFLGSAVVLFYMVLKQEVFTIEDDK